MNSSGEQLILEKTRVDITRFFKIPAKTSIMILSVGNYVELIKLATSTCSGPVPLLAVTGRNRKRMDKILKEDLPLTFEVLYKQILQELLTDIFIE